MVAVVPVYRDDENDGDPLTFLKTSETNAFGVRWVRSTVGRCILPASVINRFLESKIPMLP
jgi:hypothetical protein